MKIRELEKIVNDLGLECEWGNNLQVIMTIWQPHKNNGYNIGGKYYSADTLGEKQVQELNGKFEKLLSTIKKNKIKVKEVDTIENGVISQITLMVRFERLTNLENTTLNFEIEDFEDWSGGRWVDYNDVIPEFIGYGGSDPYSVDVSQMFRDFALKKHERDLVIENIDELFKTFTKEDNYEWIHNFIRMNGDTRPLEIALEKGVFSPKFYIEELFGNDEIYYQNEKQYTSVFKILCEYKVEDLEINKDTSYRGHLPDIVLAKPGIYKKILENWEFEYDSGQRILTFLIQDEHHKEFKQLIDSKDPKKYYFDDWYDLQEYALKGMGDYPKFIKKLFDDEWLDMEHIDYNYILDFVYNELNQVKPETMKIVVEEYMKEHQKIPLQEFMLEKLFERMEEDDLHGSFVSRPVMEVFIKYVVDGVSFNYGGGAIMLYLPDGHPLKDRLLSDDNFVQYLIAEDKLEYLPASVTDVFLF